MAYNFELSVFSTQIINDVIKNEDKINLDKINFMLWTKESLVNCAFILQHLRFKEYGITNKIRKILKHYFEWLSEQKIKPIYLSQLSPEFLSTLRNM